MALTAQGLTKAFGGELALDGVDLEIADGEIHALLGPNGSGKSTLIGCLSGRLAPDAGTMAIGGETATRFSPRAAFAAGMAVIYQHFSLVPSLSIADNVFLGSEHTNSVGRLSKSRQRREAGELLAELGVELDPKIRVSSLSVGNRQLVEIAKAMRHRPRVLILDEPTAALGEAEARALGGQLRRLRNSGLAILYVTHLLNEVFEIADRVTVLRDGRAVLGAAVGEIEREDVIKAIAPRGTAVEPSRSASDQGARESVLSLRRFSAPGVGPIDLEVADGEVLAVFGLLGSGRSELLEGLFGVAGGTSGEVSLQGKPFNPQSASRSLRSGLGLVPADRARQSVLAEMSALDNMLLPHFPQIASPVWRSRRKERRAFGNTASLLGLDPPAPGAFAKTFSGGNQQKLVVGRWLMDGSGIDVLLLDEPTQGIDVGARADLYKLVRQYAARSGRGVLFTSSDPEEVRALADRAVVISRGRLVGELRGRAITDQALLEAAHQTTETSNPSRGAHVH